MSLEHGWRILSAYRTSNGTRFWIITEADRSSTNDSAAGGILRDMPDREAIVLWLLISPLPSFPAIV